MVKAHEIGKNDTEELSLKDLLLELQKWIKYLLSNWLIILAFGICGGLIGFFYANTQKPTYIATTTFVLEEEKAGGGLGGSLSGLASIAGVDLGGGGGGIFQGDNILELYKSRSMIEKTLLTPVDLNGNKELLINRYIEFNKLRKAWAEKKELKDLKFEAFDSPDKKSNTRLQDSIIGLIVSDIDKNYLDVTKPNKKLSIFRADVKSKDELFAKTFNDQIVKNVNDFYVQTKTKKSNDNVNILQQKVDSVRRVMTGSIYKAAEVSDATPNLNPTRQIQRSAPVQSSQFSAETNKAMLIELVKNLELSKISSRKEAPLIQVVDQPVYPLVKEKLGRMKSMVIGGLLAGFLICLFLILRRVFKMILA